MEHVKGLVDSTLREGAQTVGVSLDIDQKVALAGLLGLLGIEELEVGIAGAEGVELAELVRRCRGEAGVERLSLWCRCRTDDIESAVRLKPEVLSLSIPVSDLHIASKLRCRREDVAGLVSSSLRSARREIPYLSLGLEDATRADKEFLFQIIRVACETGVDRIRLADTVGIATPAGISDLVRKVRSAFSVEVGVHMHNDFGMASANAIAALEAGAHWADVTVLGLGERAGNSRLEEVAGFLSLRAGRPYNPAIFKDLALFASRCSGREIAPQHPVVGRNIFLCETGLHLLGLSCDPVTYEPYEPSLVGGRRKLIYGEKIGRRGVAERLRQLGVQCQESQLGEFASAFRRHCRRLGRPLCDQEVLQLVAEHSA